MGNKRNLSLFVLAAVLAFGMTACSGGTAKEISFETKVQEEDFASFEIPTV